MLIDNLPRVLNFHAFGFFDLFLKQPFVLIIGGYARSGWHAERLDKVIGGATKKVVVLKGTHGLLRQTRIS